MATEGEGQVPDLEALLKLKHDIKNQLSNIHLALEGIRYEMEDQEGDMFLYMDSMMKSAQKIDRLLDVIPHEK
ncbi:MAG: hypothetical protein EOP54_24600 [Sphingobacteriales bacterium]|nr:MAG: hypothetical protein EOP54_24600 [Sphingobacteriales bacterium]